MSIVLAPGVSVVPSRGLVDMRPELKGARGRVEELEDGDLLVVKWDGLPKPYRVASKTIETVTGE
jgi:hypothetical protein